MLDRHFNKLISVGNKGLRQQKIYRCSKGRTMSTKPETVEISIADIDALHLAVKHLVAFKDLLVSYDQPFSFEMSLLIAIPIQTLKEIDENFQLRVSAIPKSAA